MPAAELAFGADDLAGANVNEEQLEQYRKEGDRSGFGTAGRVVGELASWVGPGAAVTKGLRVLQKAGKLAKTGWKPSMAQSAWNRTWPGLSPPTGGSQSG